MSDMIIKAELLDWEGESVEVITEPDGSIWFTAEYIGKKLGYTSPLSGINKLFKAHQDEFANDDSRIIQSVILSKSRSFRVFSMDGVNLLLMFSGQPKAKEFRAWLKKVATQIKTHGQYILRRKAL